MPKAVPRRAIDLALEQLELGVKEATGKNDGIPASRYNRGDKLPWCAAFVLWCNEHSDDPDITPTDKVFYSLRAVQAYEDHCRELGIWLPPTVVPERNDFVFFQTRGISDPGVGRHMGLVERVTASRYVITIEGNVSNRVKRAAYRVGDAYITGYGRIDLLLKPEPSQPSF